MANEKKRKPEMRKRRVLIVDDHPIVRLGLTQLINQEQDLVVCGEAEDVDQALRALADLEPDIAIVDISLKNSSGIELIRAIKTRHEGLPVLALSMHDESLYAERVLRCGARGYVMKQEVTESVVEALRKILGGSVYVSERMSAKILEKLVHGGRVPSDSPTERLGNRELEVFQLIGHGFGTSQIAEKLHMSVKTVEAHREHIKKKLNLKNASELLRFAIEWEKNAHQG
ncbi:MAG: response regulator transcription factor [Elusimicrobiota bacterium]